MQRFIRAIGMVSLILAMASGGYALDAFPGAEGEGRETVGGRGGTVYEVTNLNDSGAGSLRAAVEASGARTVVFRVSGTIALQSALVVANPNITIAGQTAPGDGICLKDYWFQVNASQVIVRFIRFRPGDNMGIALDGVTVLGGDNIIFDHCSASWSVDETFSVSTGEHGTSSYGQLNHVTVQWCIISESLNNSVHPDGAHSKGSLLRGGWGNKYSFHHNLYAHHYDRLPYIGNYNDYTVDPTGIYLDFRNNVVYDWGGTGHGFPASSNFKYEDTESIARVNFINNYYKEGPSTPSSLFGQKAFIAGIKHGRGYFSGNAYNGAVPSDPWSLVLFYIFWSGSDIAAYELAAPLTFADVNTEDALAAYQHVLKGAGATVPKRDAVDQRIVDDVINGTGAIIDDEDQVGGWPTLSSTAAPADSDHDGMPDVWETSKGLKVNDPSDAAADRNGDGYTNLEEYLNSLADGGTPAVSSARLWVE